MPLLLRGLDLPESEIRASIIDTLYSSASGGSQQPIVAEHASTLVSGMLKNCHAAQMPSMVHSTVSYRVLFADRQSSACAWPLCAILASSLLSSRTAPFTLIERSS
jgi:hypothetical protein